MSEGKEIDVGEATIKFSSDTVTVVKNHDGWRSRKNAWAYVVLSCATNFAAYDIISGTEWLICAGSLTTLLFGANVIEKKLKGS